MTCEVCKKDMDGRFIVLNGGALLMDRETDCGGTNPNMDAFLSLYTHDHYNESYKNEEIYSLDNVTSNGQFEWCFCSKSCIMKWFLEHLDNIPDIEPIKED